jgi:germination protein M
MRRSLPILILTLLILLGGGLGYWYASFRSPQSPAPPTPAQQGVVEITRPGQSGNDVTLKPEKRTIPPGSSQITQTLEALFETAQDNRGASAFPKGVQLRSVKIENGTATIDLSAAFLGVNQQGDTGESLAYNALRRALAQFPEVEKMRVLVEGKPFEGEHSGAWTDIPVRDPSTASGSNP